MGSDCWREKSFPTQPIQKTLRILNLLRLAKLNTSSLLLKVSCTCSALWNSFFNTREWLQKVSLCCVSFQKVCLAEVGLKCMALLLWQQPLPLGGSWACWGLCPLQVLLLHPSHPSPFQAPALFYTATNQYLLVRKKIYLTKRVTKPLSGQAHKI